MVVTAYCRTCQRTVYLGMGDSLSCPVCSSPLVAEPANRTSDDAFGARIARNESIFRSLNENLKDAAEDRGLAAAEFLCECGNRDCDARILLPIPQYERLRGEPTHFAIVPGHDVGGLEIVVERNNGYHIVEKIGPSGAIAEDLDPGS